MKVSVVICSHNSRPEYLRRTLDALRRQTFEDWELLLVDNASDEPLADSLDLSWHRQARLVREEEIGLTPARLRGIREASGELVVLIDDDNEVAPDFLREALALHEGCPFLGAFGAGLLEPEFEVQPSPRVEQALHFLALRKVKHATWSNNPRDAAAIPWGAGLCVRRAVALQYLKLVSDLNTSAILDRRGPQLYCGGDDLFSWAAAELGLGFGIFPQLRLRHLISARRVTPRYLLEMVRGHSFSHGVLRFLLMNAQPEPIRLFRYAHLALHGLRNGLFSMQCQWAASRGETQAWQFIRQRNLQPAERPSYAGATLSSVGELSHVNA